MAELDIVGGAAVDVVPVIPQFHNKLKALVLPIADKVGEEAGRRMGQAMSRNIVIAIPDAIRDGGRAGVVAAGRQGDDAGGEFSRSLKRKLEVAFKVMPKLQVGLADTGVDAELWSGTLAISDPDAGTQQPRLHGDGSRCAKHPRGWLRPGSERH